MISSGRMATFRSRCNRGSISALIARSQISDLALLSRAPIFFSSSQARIKLRVFSILVLLENKAPLHRPATRQIFGKSSYHFIDSRSLFAVETGLKKIPDAFQLFRLRPSVFRYCD